MKKRLFIILILFISLFGTNVNASTKTFDRTEDNLLVPNYVEVTERNKSNILLTPAVDAKEKIYDFADIFSDNEEKMLYSQVYGFTRKTDLDLAIVTISYNNKHNTPVYADDFYDYNSFGIGEDRSGLLLLIDMDTKRIYVSTTGKAISIYTDDRINKMLDNVFSYYSNNEYFKGTSIFINYVYSYAEVSPDDAGYVISDTGEVTKNRKGILIAGIFAIIVTVVSLLVMASKNKLARVANSSIVFLRKDTLKVKVVSDEFVGESVTKTKIDNDSSKKRSL